MDDTNIGIYIWSILIWVCPDEICALEQKLRVIELHTYKELLKVRFTIPRSHSQQKPFCLWC